MNDASVYRRLTELEAIVKSLQARTSITYDKGTVVPSLKGAGTAGTFTYDTNATKLEWTRRGDRIAYQGRVAITATTVAPTGNLTIEGFPAAGVSDASMGVAGGGWVIWSKINLPANYWSVSLQINNGSTAAFIARSGTNNALAVVQGGELVGGVYDFRFGGEYRIV